MQAKFSAAQPGASIKRVLPLINGRGKHDADAAPIGTLEQSLLLGKSGDKMPGKSTAGSKPNRSANDRKGSKKLRHIDAAARLKIGFT
jgi:hypothetical protein